MGTRSPGRAAVLGIGAWVVLSAHALIQPPAPVRLTPERAIATRRLSDLQWSPDGGRLAFTVSGPPGLGERRTRVWVWERASGQVRQFTNSGGSEHAPRWSPDGTMLAFLSDRDERAQIFLMRAAGGEAWALTHGRQSVSGFEWSPDGRRLAMLAPEPTPEALEKRQKDKDDARVVDRDDRPAHLWTVSTETGEVSSVVGPPWKFSEVRWLPGGDGVIVVATDHPESDRWTDRIFSVALAAPRMDEIAAPAGPFGDVRVSADGDAIAFGTEDGPAYDEWFYGLLYQRPDGFDRSSPLTYITKARTPTLILQCEADVIDPIGQSQALSGPSSATASRPSWCCTPARGTACVKRSTWWIGSAGSSGGSTRA